MGCLRQPRQTDDPSLTGFLILQHTTQINHKYTLQLSDCQSLQHPDALNPPAVPVSSASWLTWQQAAQDQKAGKPITTSQSERRGRRQHSNRMVKPLDLISALWRRGNRWLLLLGGGSVRCYTRGGGQLKRQQKQVPKCCAVHCG